MATPIRVGFIGLSGKGWGPAAHIPYLIASPKYKIVAVCNTSVASAQASIKQNKLGPETKAYGDPQDLANDSNVQLVVCVVRVDRHAPAIIPSIKAGKRVFVEWPLAKNLSEAEELLQLSKEHHVTETSVCLQGRFAPVIMKMKKLMKEGKIGKVLSSTFIGHCAELGLTLSHGLKYVAEKEVGGNLKTIYFGHMVDCVQEVLGSIESASSLVTNQRPVVALLNAEGKVEDPQFFRNTPDHLALYGKFSSGAVLSMAMRGGTPFPGTPALDWKIYGSKGEIRMTSQQMLINLGSPVVELSVYAFESGQVERIDLGKDEWEHLPLVARNVARQYEAIADGDTSVVCDFEEAVTRHRFIQDYVESGEQTIEPRL